MTTAKKFECGGLYKVTSLIEGVYYSNTEKEHNTLCAKSGMIVFLIKIEKQGEFEFVNVFHVLFNGRVAFIRDNIKHPMLTWTKVKHC